MVNKETNRKAIHLYGAADEHCHMTGKQFSTRPPKSTAPPCHA